MIFVNVLMSNNIIYYFRGMKFIQYDIMSKIMKNLLLLSFLYFFLNLNIPLGTMGPFCGLNLQRCGG